MSPDADARGHGPVRRGGLSRRRGSSWRHAIVAVLFLLVAVFVLGPRPTFEDRWREARLPDSGAAGESGGGAAMSALSRHIADTEARVPGVRSGDQAEIIWADPGAPAPTPLALVYLHGFSADRHEVEPVVTRIGRELDANVYFTRLTGHGRDGAAMADATAADWLDDTAEAVAIGARIGDRVVLVGTSTGGTLATWAAMRAEARGRVDAVVLISPNYQPADRSSRLLLWPWGGVLARLVVGEERCFQAENEEQERHWTTCYPITALLPMMALVEHVRTSALGGWEVPVLLVYSPDDEVVDASETERVLAGLPQDMLRVHRVHETGDPAHHVLAGDVLSPETNEELSGVVVSFVRDALGLAGTR